MLTRTFRYLVHRRRYDKISMIFQNFSCCEGNLKHWLLGLTLLCFSARPIAHAEKFGIIGSRDTIGDFLASRDVSHTYDSREWLGQATEAVCSNLDLVRDLLYISMGACITPRFAAAIERPLLFIPLEVSVDGCLEEVSNSPGAQQNIVPLYLFGNDFEKMVPGVLDGLSWSNAVIIHICDKYSYCGSTAVSGATESIHQQQITTIQCHIKLVNQETLVQQLPQCLQMADSQLSFADQRLLFVINTNYSVVMPIVEMLSSRFLMNMWTEIAFTLPPTYQVEESDFAVMKDHDNIQVVTWLGSDWLASITAITMPRYSVFWEYTDAPEKGKFGRNLAGLLTATSATSYFAGLISAQNPYDVMPWSSCSANSTEQIRAISADMSKTLSCSTAVGRDVCSGYKITKYALDPVNNSPQPEITGYWSAEKGYQNLYYRQVDDLQGRKLLVVTILSPPFLQRNVTATQSSDGADTLDMYHGIIPNMLITLSRVLNFRFEIRLPNSGDDFYGVRSSNGQWNGMMGMLQRHEVDLIAADLTVDAEREAVVDFTVPFYEDELTVLLPRSEFDKSMFTFLSPFSKPVWCCVIGAVALSGPLLFLFSRLSPYYQRKGTPNHFASLSEAYMYCYGSIVSQGGQVTPDADSSRIFMVFWWLFGICTVATYSGNLIAFLTFPGRLQFLDNFDEFVYQSNIEPVVVRNSYGESVFRDSHRQSYMDLWQRMQASKGKSFVDAYQEAVLRVSEDKQAYIGQLSNMKATMAKNSEDEGECLFAHMRHPLEKVNYALAFRKGTNYAQIFNKWIRRMSYSGLIGHWADQEWNRGSKPKRCQKELEVPPNDVRKVKIGDVLGVYICLGIGCAFSVLVFVTEKVVAHSHRFGKHIRTFLDKSQPQTSNDHALKVVTLNNGMILRRKNTQKF